MRVKEYNLTWRHFANYILYKYKIDFNPKVIQIDTPFDLKEFPHAFQSLLLIFLDSGPPGQEDTSLSGLHRLAFL